MNYQGRLTGPGGSAVADGPYDVIFTIYDSDAGGATIWSETVEVNTADGLFSILLGGVTPLNEAVFSDASRYLGITVVGESEMSPRTQLSTVPYAFQAGSVASSATGHTPHDSWLSPYFAVEQRALAQFQVVTLVTIYNAHSSSNRVTLTFYDQAGVQLDQCIKTLAVGELWRWDNFGSACIVVSDNVFYDGYFTITAQGPVAPWGMTIFGSAYITRSSSAALTFYKM
jgi:hypothetical protein